MDRSRYGLLFALMDLYLVSGQVIINTEPNKLVDGESGSVTCSYNNAYSMSITRINESNTIANCVVYSPPVVDCIITPPGPNNNYIDYRGFYTVSKTTTSITIHINTVSKQRDGGNWECSGQGLQADSSFQKNTTIDVKVPVKDVEIENKNSLNLVNGVSTTMNCKVTNNPDPVINYRWFIVETNQTLSTTSSFQLTPNKNQNGQTLSCSADNRYGSSKSDTVILHVQYKPSVKIEPEVSGNYKIIEGNTVELKCIVTDANPKDAGSLSYKWYKDTTTTLPGQVGSTVQISQEGIYTCSVFNGIGTGISDSITIDVLFPPRVTLIPQYSIIESNTLTIPCIATSNPVPNNYTWSGPNNLIQSQQNLTISSINRDQTGQYTCTVSNIMIPTKGGQQTGSRTGDTDITVLYGPEVGVSTSRINIIESNKLVINCTVIQSKPDDASINWYKPDGTSISSNILSIDNTRRDQGGIYSCNSSKVLTPSIGSTKTNVDSKTTIVNIWYLDPVKITRDKLDIQEGDKINITCTTQSNPTASITYRNGTDVIQTDNSNQASFIKLTATCLDTNVYSCQVNNPNIPETSYNDTIQILVHCSPRPDPRVDHQYKITGNIGESVELTAQVISYPKPIFQWYYIENNVDIPIVNNGSFQQTDRSTNINTFISKLTINITTNKFYRRYYINVSNEVNPGGSDLQYNIISETVPDPPINITFNETSDIICVEWTPGFYGGASQSFIVQHSTDDKTWVNSSTIPDGTNNGRVDYCIEGLEPDTNYYIRVIASNKYGESLIGTLSQGELPKTAQEIKGNTDNTGNTGNTGGTDDNNSTTLIGGVVGAGLALVVILIFLVLIIRRRKSKSQGRNKETDSQLVLNETPSPNQMIIDENPAYVSVDDLQNDKVAVKEADTSKAAPTDTAVNKSKPGADATPVYSAVNKKKEKDTKKEVKNKSKGKKQIKNQNPQTKKRGEVYENVGIFGNRMYDNNSHESTEQVTKENDDLVYVDLKFDKKPSNKVIKKPAEEDKVEYGSIDYGKRGPTPPPASDSSDDEMDYLPPRKDETSQ